ncbi:Peptidase S8, subtilisin-related [Phytophthora cactorum]|nr:Peptidase S8, subtilisin-related [Phytophthora cactorum]
MTRLKFASFLLVTTMLTIVVRGAQTGLLGNLLTTVGTVTSTAVSSLVETVGNLPYNSHQIIVFMDGDTKSILDVVANNNTLFGRRLSESTESAAVQYTSNWISNTIVVLDCPLVLIERILALLSVKKIIYDVIITLDPPQPTADSTSNTTTAGWGANKIKATITHETLVNNWIGAYGWYDPAQKTATPFDANGHGTHTMATIVGGKGVGIAPGAKWMACKACGSSCTLSLLNACAQFMLCPTDTNGNNCNAAKAPHIVSNSWGTGQGLTYFQPMLDAWSAARIIPVFSAGNSGANGCSSVVSPGDSAKAFSIGASDTSDALGSFSSIGPAVNGLVKPDFIALGMAAPHFAGTIALALSARPGFCFDSLKEVLTSSTDRSLPTTALTCGGISDTVFPNNEYGYGRINAQNVVNAALAY